MDAVVILATAHRQEFNNMAKPRIKSKSPGTQARTYLDISDRTRTKRRRAWRDGIKALRVSLGLNQSEFWGSIGVTQSGGSRYEGGRSMPKPVRQAVLARYLGEPIPPFFGRLEVAP